MVITRVHFQNAELIVLFIHFTKFIFYKGMSPKHTDDLPFAGSFYLRKTLSRIYSKAYRMAETSLKLPGILCECFRSVDEFFSADFHFKQCSNH